VRLHPETAPSFEAIVGGDGADLIPVSRLHFVKRVGSGAFCKVDICDLATPDAPKATRVAVKRLNPGGDAVVAVDLAVEARLLRTLRHPYITRYIGCGTDTRGASFLVEEYVGGGTLNRAVSRQSVRPHKTLFTVAQAAEWAEQIADALAYLHGSNPVVIHRDLKLANILLRPVADEGEGGAGATPATAAVLAAAAGRFPPPPGVKYIVALCDFGLSSSIINPALSRRSEWHAARGEGPPPPPHPEPSPPPSAMPSPTLEPDRRRTTSNVREQFARLSRGQEFDDPALAGRSAALGAALPTSRAPAGRQRRRRGTMLSGKSPVGDLTGRTGSYMYMAPEVGRWRERGWRAILPRSPSPPPHPFPVSTGHAVQAVQRKGRRLLLWRRPLPTVCAANFLRRPLDALQGRPRRLRDLRRKSGARVPGPDPVEVAGAGAGARDRVLGARRRRPPVDGRRAGDARTPARRGLL
jgi:hypothetical protein